MDRLDETVARLVDRYPGWPIDSAVQVGRAVLLFQRGTFSQGSLNKRATVACLPPSSTLNDGTLLKHYQVEDVMAMRMMERNTHTPLRLPSGETLYHNIGILGEPPGSGSMLTVITHLMSSVDRAPNPENTYYSWMEDENENTKKRTLSHREYSYGMVLPPVDRNTAPKFCGATVVLCSGFGADVWASTIEKVAPSLKPLLVTKQADLATLSRRHLDELSERDGWVIIVAATMFGAFYDRHGGHRFSRLVIDDAGSVTGRYVPRLRTCFTWLVESTIEQYLLPFALAPDQRVDPVSYDHVCSTLQDAGMTDLSSVVIRHSLEEISRECQIEFPLHIHYECSEHEGIQQLRRHRTWDSYEAIRPLELSSPSEQERAVMLMRTGAQICTDARAAGLGAKRGARERILGWRKDTCSVCWNGLGGEERGWGETCIMPCCSQLLCFECTDKISSAPVARCPICREDILESRVRLLTESPSSIPRNLCLDRSEYWNRPIRSTLSAVLNTMTPGSRVVLWTLTHTFHLNFRHLGDFVERHGFSSCRPLNGSKYQIKNTLRNFNEDRDAIDAAQKKAVFITASWEARGCRLHAATDIIFLAEVSTSVYQHVMARVLNVANPSIDRRNSCLRVHMLHCKGRSYPELLLAREGLGTGTDPERYAARIRRCQEEAAAAFAGRRRHYLWPVDIEDDY